MGRGRPVGQERGDLFEEMAGAYVAFLQGFPWGLPLAEEGGREGLTKFLKNSYLGRFRGNKYRKAPLITAAALERFRASGSGLIFEHVVPTTILQQDCEVLARSGSLTRELVLKWLRSYWVTAVVTKEEDRRLVKDYMPSGWDGLDPFARYRMAGLRVMPHPDALPGLPTPPETPEDCRAR